MRTTEEHHSFRPSRRSSIIAENWAEKDGYLKGLAVSASQDARVYYEAACDPDGKKQRAIKFLFEFIGKFAMPSLDAEKTRLDEKFKKQQALLEKAQQELE